MRLQMRDMPRLRQLGETTSAMAAFRMRSCQRTVLQCIVQSVSGFFTVLVNCKQVRARLGARTFLGGVVGPGWRVLVQLLENLIPSRK